MLQPQSQKRFGEQLKLLKIKPGPMAGAHYEELLQNMSWTAFTGTLLFLRAQILLKHNSHFVEVSDT